MCISLHNHLDLISSEVKLVSTLTNPSLSGFTYHFFHSFKHYIILFERDASQNPGLQIFNTRTLRCEHVFVGENNPLLRFQVLTACSYDENTLFVVGGDLSKGLMPSRSGTKLYRMRITENIAGQTLSLSFESLPGIPELFSLEGNFYPRGSLFKNRSLYIFGKRSLMSSALALWEFNIGRNFM